MSGHEESFPAGFVVRMHEQNFYPIDSVMTDGKVEWETGCLSCGFRFRFQTGRTFIPSRRCLPCRSAYRLSFGKVDQQAGS